MLYFSQKRKKSQERIKVCYGKTFEILSYEKITKYKIFHFPCLLLVCL